MLSERKNTYKAVLAKMKTISNTEQKIWMITKDKIPYFEINEWLEKKSLKKITTGKQYASILCVYLNYLDMLSLTFKTAKKKNILNFIDYLVYGESLNIFCIEPQVTYSTLSKYISVITGFYRYLDSVSAKHNIHADKRSSNHKKESFYYGQIWKTDYYTIIEEKIEALSGTKEYIKWYTQEEKEAIISNFKSLRDKSIFLLSLEGMRIDEVLSVRLSDYDPDKRTLKPSRSKGKETQYGQQNKLRTIVLPTSTAKLLDRYILTERTDAEIQSGILSDWLFINLRKDRNLGKPLSYRSFWETLKKCSERAGLNSEKIRTHSGRSTKVMELLEYQASHPNEISDVAIQQLMGWKRLSSIEPYVDYNNEILTKSTYDKIHKET